MSGLKLFLQTTESLACAAEGVTLANSPQVSKGMRCFMYIFSIHFLLEAIMGVGAMLFFEIRVQSVSSSVN